MNSRFSLIVGALGRILIGLGLIVLAFAGYQLWGTGLLESRAQDRLETEFAERQAELAALGVSPPTSSPRTTSPSPTTAGDAPTTTGPPTTQPVVIAPELAAELLPKQGEPLGYIRIPTIGLERAIVEGVSRDDLRKGPGHYSNTPLPGQAGNAAIAGHRTTYGQPFYDLDKLDPGDVIELETLQGTFYYEVMPQTAPDGSIAGHFIVDPTQVDIINDFGDNRITLTACHPKRSARQRIVVTALMVGVPAPTIEAAPEGALDADDRDADEALDSDTIGSDSTNESGDATRVGADQEPESLDESLGWNMENLQPTLLWAALASLVLLGGWLIGRAWRRVPAYLLTAPVFLAVLFAMFIYLDRMLPAF